MRSRTIASARSCARRRTSASRGSPTASFAAPFSTSISSSGWRASRPTTASMSRASARRRNAGRLQAADHACREQGQMGRADPGAGLRLPQVGRDADAEGLHPRAVDAAFSRRSGGDQRGRLSQPRGFLPGPHRGLSRRGRRSCGARASLSAIRRHQSRLSLRPRDPRPHQGARRRSGRADAPLLPAGERVRSATAPQT